MAILTHGLETLEIGATTPREIINANLQDLDTNRIFTGPIGSRPAAGDGDRFYYATDEQVLYYDNGGSWETVAGGGGTGFLSVQFFGNVQVTDASNFKIMQKKVYFPIGAEINAAQVSGVGGVDPTKLNSDTTRIHVSDTDYDQAGSPNGFDLDLPGDAGDARASPGMALTIGSGSYAYIFLTLADGNHLSPSVLLET